MEGYILLEDSLIDSEEEILKTSIPKLNKIARAFPDEAAQEYFLKKAREDYQNQGRFLS